MSIETSNKLRQVFKRFNPFMIWLWRLGFRRWINAWPAVGGRIMVITHTGRKTGSRRRSPVNYAVVDGEIYCTAGFGPGTDWYRNILKHPDVELWLPDGWWAGTAEDTSQHEHRTAILRQVIIASGVVGPMVGVNAQKMSDADFAQATTDYCLIHIQRTKPLSGAGGPGDLAWIWVPVLMVMAWLGYLVWRRR
jgi:deazaflavin-dependent oxidoreductase (nitroreductase family)